MFDIVAPEQNKLALPVHVEDVDDADPRLAGPAAIALDLQPAARDATQDQACDDDEDQNKRQGDDRLDRC